MENYFHQPVLLREVIDFLNPSPNQNFIDCTIGGGGHALAILERIAPKGKLLGIDLDPEAISTTKSRAQNLGFKARIILVSDNFKNLKKIVQVYQFNKINGILLDLGLSSAQIQNHSRGFSFLAEGPLNMRFDKDKGLTAQEILNTWSQKRIYEIFKNYGQEKLAKPISQKITEIRQKQKISSPEILVNIISQVYKKYYKGKSKVNPATKVFQSLRIAVNQELENLKEVLPQAIQLLLEGGRLAVISYHSLEDKIIKDFFKKESKDCLCPPQLPQCQCHHKKILKIITKKPIIPTQEELINNPRSRSAKLRVAEKL